MERYSNQGQEKNEEMEQMARDYLNLAKELSESQKVFEFSGINQKYYSTTKREAKEMQEQGCVFSVDIVPIDELIAKFKEEKITVVLGTDKDSGNVFVAPAKTAREKADNLWGVIISPRHLLITGDMGEDLKNLIAMSEKLHAYRQNI